MKSICFEKDAITNKAIFHDIFPKKWSYFFQQCVANFKERMDLLDGFAKHLISKRSELKETINMKEKESDTELEVMQAKSDLKNVQLFVSVVTVNSTCLQEC